MTFWLVLISTVILRYVSKALFLFNQFINDQQLVLRPWGWSSSKPKDYEKLKALGDGMANAIYKVHKITYQSIAAYELYYASGIANDWFYGLL